MSQTMAVDRPRYLVGLETWCEEQIRNRHPSYQVQLRPPPTDVGCSCTGESTKSFCFSCHFEVPSQASALIEIFWDRVKFLNWFCGLETSDWLQRLDEDTGICREVFVIFGILRVEFLRLRARRSRGETGLLYIDAASPSKRLDLNGQFMPQDVMMLYAEPTPNGEGSRVTFLWNVEASTFPILFPDQDFVDFIRRYVSIMLNRVVRVGIELSSVGSINELEAPAPLCRKLHHLNGAAPPVGATIRMEFGQLELAASTLEMLLDVLRDEEEHETLATQLTLLKVKHEGVPPNSCEKFPSVRAMPDYPPTTSPKLSGVDNFKVLSNESNFGSHLSIEGIMNSSGSNLLQEQQRGKSMEIDDFFASNPEIDLHSGGTRAQPCRTSNTGSSTAKPQGNGLEISPGTNSNAPSDGVVPPSPLTFEESCTLAAAHPNDPNSLTSMLASLGRVDGLLSGQMTAGDLISAYKADGSGDPGNTEADVTAMLESLSRVDGVLSGTLSHMSEYKTGSESAQPVPQSSRGNGRPEETDYMDSSMPMDPSLFFATYGTIPDMKSFVAYRSAGKPITEEALQRDEESQRFHSPSHSLPMPDLQHLPTLQLQQAYAARSKMQPFTPRADFSCSSSNAANSNSNQMSVLPPPRNLSHGDFMAAKDHMAGSSSQLNLNHPFVGIEGQPQGFPPHSHPSPDRNSRLSTWANCLVCAPSSKPEAPSPDSSASKKKRKPVKDGANSSMNGESSDPTPRKRGRPKTKLTPQEKQQLVSSAAKPIAPAPNSVPGNRSILGSLHAMYAAQFAAISHMMGQNNSNSNSNPNSNGAPASSSPAPSATPSDRGW